MIQKNFFKFVALCLVIFLYQSNIYGARAVKSSSKEVDSTKLATDLSLKMYPSSGSTEIPQDTINYYTLSDPRLRIFKGPVSNLQAKKSKECPAVKLFNKRQILERLLNPKSLMNDLSDAANSDRIGFGKTRARLILCGLEVNKDISKRCLKNDLNKIKSCFSKQGKKLNYLKDNSLRSFDFPPTPDELAQLSKTFSFEGKTYKCDEKLDYALSTDHMLDRGGGDCEDFTILLATALRYIGYPEDKIKLAVGYKKGAPFTGHVWLNLDLADLNQKRRCLPNLTKGKSLQIESVGLAADSSGFSKFSNAVFSYYQNQSMSEAYNTTGYIKLNGEVQDLNSSAPILDVKTKTPSN